MKEGSVRRRRWHIFALSGPRLVVRNGREAATYERPLAG